MNFYILTNNLKIICFISPYYFELTTWKLYYFFKKVSNPEMLFRLLFRLSNLENLI